MTPAIYAQDDAKAKRKQLRFRMYRATSQSGKQAEKILMQNNQDEVRGIASMSKMISQYLILEAIKNR